LGDHYISDVTNEGDFRILANGRTWCVEGILTNTGTITVNPEGSADDAIIYSHGDVRIEGEGEILLHAIGDVGDAQFGSQGGGFVQGGDHLIHGSGAIYVYLTNEGTVRADTPGRRLSVATAGMRSQGLLEAAEGGELQLSAINFENRARVVARDGGEVRADQMGLNYNPYTRQLTGGRWEVCEGSTMRLMGVDPLMLNADVLLSGEASCLCQDDAGTPTLTNLTDIMWFGHLEVASGRDFALKGALSNAGRLTVGEACSLTVPGAYTQTGNKPSSIQHDGWGWTTVNGTFSSPESLRFEGGSLKGNGTVVGNVKSRARVSPGVSAGTLTIDGGCVQTADGHLCVELGDSQSGDHDLLVVTGHADLDGRIWVAPLEGFTPGDGDTFTVMTFASHDGSFAEEWGCAGVGLDYEVIYEPNAVKIALFTALSDVEEPEDPEQPQEPVIIEDPVDTDPVTAGQLPAEVSLRSQMIGGRACLHLDLPEAADVILEIFDFSGRRVAGVHQGHLAAGSRSFVLPEGRSVPERLASGVYLARATVRSAGHTTVRSARVLLVR
jgi:hypothetical protein